jgi:hypothetical protein
VPSDVRQADIAIAGTIVAAAINGPDADTATSPATSRASCPELTWARAGILTSCRVV